MLSRRTFIRSSAAFGAFTVTRLLGSAPAGAVSTWESPPSIDNTGRRDVSLALTDWLATTGQPGDIFKLRRGQGYAPGAFYVPRGVAIRREIQLDLNGCWLYTGPDDGSAYPPLYDDHLDTSGSPWPKTRYCLSIVTSDAYLFSSLPYARIQGAARGVGFMGSEPYGCNYDPALEGQHAIRVLGNNNLINLSHIAAEFCYGDGVYVAQGSTGTWVIGRNLGAPVSQGLGGTISGSLWYPDMASYSGIHHTARHGVATSCATGLLIHGLSVWHNGRATFDLEPNGASDVVDSVQISETETGLHRLLWIAAAGLRAVSNVTVVDNICYDRLSIDTRDPYATARHANWSIVRNQGGLVFGSPNDCFELDRIDTLEVRDNFQVVDGRRSSMGIDIGTSTDVTISPSEALQFPVA